MTAAWATYDDFTGDSAHLWEDRVVHDGSGAAHLLCDPTARVSAGGGVREVRIERFTRHHSDGVQNLDNPKHLSVSTGVVEVPAGGTAWFRVEMAAEPLGWDGIDYRDGFATFNVIDIDHKLIFDAITTGPRIHGLYELQARPVGMVPQEESFLWVVDNAELPVRPEPGEFHTYEVRIDTGRSMLESFVDGHRLFHAASLPVVPKRFKLGMGILTLRQLAPDGTSTSRRGQGMVARWRNVEHLVRGPEPEGTAP